MSGMAPDTGGTVVQPTGSNLHTVVDSGTITSITNAVAVTNAGLTNLDVALSTRLKPADTLAGVTTVAAVTAITNALPAGTNRIGSVRPVDSADADLTAVKGSQTSRAIGVQNLTDSGRTAISFYAHDFASGTTGTEKIITWDQSKGTGAVTAGTASYTITNGKTLRITGLTVGTRGHATATAQATVFSLRLNTAGAAIVTSTPILIQIESATPATALAWDRASVDIGDGYEIVGNGTASICITANSVFVTNAPIWTVNLVGYEY